MDEQADEQARTEIRILSYNVRSLRDDRTALARVIGSCRPDVVCVQESPRFIGWRRSARHFAADLGMHVICGGADASGNLLLGADRVVVEDTETLYLKHRIGRYLRGMALAVVRIGEARLTVASTHLSLDAAQRLEQVDEVLGHLDRMVATHSAHRTTQAQTQRAQGQSVILCGDFNAHPGSPEWSVLAARMQDAWAVAPLGEEFSSTASDPYQRIDAVFASPDVEVVGAGVPVHLASQADMTVASDHRPVLAVLRV